MSREPIDRLVPPSAASDAPLREALARDAARRLRRALAAWGRFAPPAPSLARFAGIRPESGRFRTWLADVEDALALARAAARRSASGRTGLVALAADAGVLARLAPGGRIPGDFRRRAAAEARRRLAANARALGALAAEPASPGERLEVGRLLVERGLAVVESRRVPAFERRVLEALARLAAAWPEGAALVTARTWRVVPVTAWATVSYSSARQPGILYINVNSAPLVRLAEDLVHESIHARLHEIESLAPLVAARAAGDGPRFYSPWRREWRPLRGLVHAVCTFTAGAMFFEKMLVASDGGGERGKASPARRRWLARRLLEERASVASSLAVLRGARREGWLTAAGERVIGAAAREHRALARAARARAAWLVSTRAGRLELARVERLERSLVRRPVRWGWSVSEETPASA